MKKFILMMVVMVAVLGTMVGCTGGYVADYKSAEEFEAAINNGDSVEGTYVMVEVIGLEPNSAFGYNTQAGDHLNFVNAVNPNVEQGDFVVFKVERVANIFGSIIITYEEHKVVK